jgi:diguanylate cyclase (GGDEF)-like protein/PAS domain S-box-containing protein
MHLESDLIRILLVDDRSENLVALEALLDSPSIRLVKCLNGEEAIKQAMKEEFALILLDVQMPGLDGYETARMIKLREKNKYTPIIFITAINKEREHVAEGYKLGAIDYVFKPFEPDVLKLKVEQFIHLYNVGKKISTQAGLLREKTHELEAANLELSGLASQLKKAEELARAVGQTSTDTILILDEATRIINANPAAQPMFGYEDEELLSQNVSLLFPGGFSYDPMAATEAAASAAVEGLKGTRSDARPQVIHGARWEVAAHKKDGTPFPAELRINETRVSGETIYVCTVRDITEQVEHMQRLTYMATHDDLTGLLNRNALYEMLEQALRAPAHPFALLLLDLDQFKMINDTLGHRMGDLLLSELGRQLRGLLREGETVFRLGGDEFAFLLIGCDEVRGAKRAAEILAHIEQPLHLEQATLSLGGSLGVVAYPDHGVDKETLVRRADVAMYAAKRSGGGYAVYHADQDFNDPYRLRLMGDLRSAVDKDELVLVYQPEALLMNGEVVFAEALLRWNHPEFGLISPADFINIAEQIGLIHSLTMWVLRKAIRQCKQWEEEGMPIGVAINLSVRHLQDVELPHTIQRLLDEYGVAPEKITLEITESFLMTDPERARGILLGIHRMGVQLAIDDFGTGYSSLAYLKHLPVNLIKIDKSFVSDMMNDHKDSMIVQSIIYLAHNMGLRVVAEGVEDQNVWEMLNAGGCDIAQGYHLQKPMSVQDFKKWYESRRREGSTG